MSESQARLTFSSNPLVPAATIIVQQQMTDPNNNNLQQALGGSSKPMRMCIVGGGGYLGKLLARELQHQGHSVVLLDLQFASFPLIQLCEKRTRRIKGSITNRTDLRTALEGCDACFHLAGYGMSGGASLDPHGCFLVNVLGTRLLLEECVRLRVSRLLFTSSISVIFDGRNELHMADEREVPYVEENFGNAYVETKCAAEKLVLAANDPATGLSTCALRLRGIYGPGEMRSVQRCVELCRRGLVKCTFSKSSPALTQYSSAENSVYALVLAEKSLRDKGSPAAGNAYNIVDDGPPVDPWAFWFPLIAAVGCPLPRIRLPYRLVYGLAILFELLHRWLGLEPFFTRYEVGLMAVTNTFSIQRAKRDLGYAPKRNHDLGPTIQCVLGHRLATGSRSKAQPSSCGLPHLLGRCPVRSDSGLLAKALLLLLALLLCLAAAVLMPSPVLLLNSLLRWPSALAQLAKSALSPLLPS